MQVDLFGNFIVEEEELVRKTSKPSPFSFTNNVANKKYPDSLEGYSPWLFNVSYSQRRETVFFANEMNKYHQLPEKAQFDFYYHALPKKNFFAKWAKADRIEHIDSICAYYECSEKEALTYCKVLTDTQITQITQWVNQSKGGNLDSRSSSNVHGTKHLPRSKK